MTEKQDPGEYASRLHEAFDHAWTTESDKIISVLAGMDPSTMEKVKNSFAEKAGYTLEHVVRHKLRGDFQACVLAIIQEPDEYDADLLYDAMEGVGTKDHILIEILVTRSSEHLKKVSDIFIHKRGKSLEKWVASETSGDYKKYMMRLVQGSRVSSAEKVNQEKVKEDVKALYSAGEGRLGTNESVFIEIFAERSWKHMRLVSEGYANEFRHSLETAVKKEFSGDIEKALIWSLEFFMDRHAFFARRIHESIEGVGTKDKDLIRLMASRRTVDLYEIAEEYEKIYRKSLKEDVADDTSGNYRELLVQMIKSS